MMLSKKTKYALKALTALAREPNRGAVVASQLAVRERIPQQFLELILFELKRLGLLQSRRGRGGGHLLNRPPEEISVGQVIRALDGPALALPRVRARRRYAVRRVRRRSDAAFAVCSNKSDETARISDESHWRTPFRERR
jgi:Rrf2 family protein